MKRRGARRPGIDGEDDHPGTIHISLERHVDDQLDQAELAELVARNPPARRLGIRENGVRLAFAKVEDRWVLP